VQPFLGELKLVGFDFAPPGWVLCDGRLLAIAENDTLFAVIGFKFGGDGESTFALPDLRDQPQAGLNSIMAVTGIFPSHG
jgi:microcystin-dependent protein